MGDEEKVSALDRLAALLDAKDQELREARETIEGLEQNLRGTESGWSLPVKLPEEQTLPVPRLELLYEHQDEQWYEVIVKYRLVYRHLLDHCVAVPLGETTIRGGSDGPPVRGGKIDLPVRDGCHIACDARTLHLPAFAICGEWIEAIPARENPTEWEKRNAK